MSLEVAKREVSDELDALVRELSSQIQQVKVLFPHIPEMAKNMNSYILDQAERLVNPQSVQVFRSNLYSARSQDEVNAFREYICEQHMRGMLKTLQSMSRVAWNQITTEQMQGLANQFQAFQQRSAQTWDNLFNRMAEQRQEDGLGWMKAFRGGGCALCSVQPCPCNCPFGYIQGRLCTKCGHLGH